MTWLRSAHADEFDQKAQQYMSRHEVTYLQALRAVLPEESYMSKYTTATAGVEVDRRATRYVEQHEGISYKEAHDAVLAADPELRTAYAQPAPRRRVRTLATVDPRSTPAVPISPAEEAEIADWISRAITDGKAGALLGALGQLSVEADAFKKLGMSVEEATRRAMDLFPHLRDLAGIQLRDIRRNAPGMPTGETTAAQAAGDIVHTRAKALAEKHRLDYHEAMGVVLAEDPALKSAYART